MSTLEQLARREGRRGRRGEGGERERGGGGPGRGGERERKEISNITTTQCCSTNSLTMKILTISGPRMYTAVMYPN